MDAMSDEQIVVLFRGLYLAEGEGNQDSDPFDQFVVASRIWGKVVDEVTDLASRAPERVRNLVAKCASSEDATDRDLAAFTAQSLVHYDYYFTRDTLISLIVDNFNLTHATYSYAAETARESIGYLMRDELTPEQAADFNDEYRRRGEHVVHVGYIPIEPALPEEQRLW